MTGDRHLKTLKRAPPPPPRSHPLWRRISTPTQPTLKAIAFCQKLTGVIAFRKRLGRRVRFLADDPLEAPLKGFPPNQRNLISAIETWLGEI
ncbi:MULTISPECIES: NACHT C-terminal alpha/beta 1 domain-containing protein [Limnospira]|uniref:NACHT C-terminal alpha/beta 1 domain-containing protein n=1 Tax=Limnospira TaxID=2596745 RepID=UPI003D6ABFC4